jgi:hypothetical protein
MKKAPLDYAEREDELIAKLRRDLSREKAMNKRLGGVIDDLKKELEFEKSRSTRARSERELLLLRCRSLALDVAKMSEEDVNAIRGRALDILFKVRRDETVRD